MKIARRHILHVVEQADIIGLQTSFYRNYTLTAWKTRNGWAIRVSNPDLKRLAKLKRIKKRARNRKKAKL